MKIVAETAKSDIATVFIAEVRNGKLIEFVESTQPPVPREKKWVLIISTLLGCPVGCQFCDSGWHYDGKLTKDDLFEQIDYLVSLRYPNKIIPIEKFKIQFARMGEPALNDAVLEVLEEFHSRYDAKGFLPSLSTVAPIGRNKFFDKLLEIKQNIYKDNFQLQFSIHSTNEEQRNQLIPIKKMSFQEISEYSNRFYQKGDKKITLNFALSESSIVSTPYLKTFFSPDTFIIKLTPVNPTSASITNNVKSLDFFSDSIKRKVDKFKAEGYEVIVSIGELEENKIGSNCGQYITNYLKKQNVIDNAYTYQLQYID